METSQNIATESFSCNWLTNRQLSFDSLSEHPFRKSIDFFDEKSSEETKNESSSFIFHLPTSKFPATLVHADEIFSHGLILPKYGERSNKEAFGTSNSTPYPSGTSLLRRNPSPNDRIHVCFLGKWRKMSKKILQKYFAFFRPLCREVGCTRRNVRVDDFNGKNCTAKGWNNSPQFSPPRGKTNNAENWAEMKMRMRKVRSMGNSPQGSPPRSPNYHSGDWGMDCSIDEAILHCKKSFEK